MAKRPLLTLLRERFPTETKDSLFARVLCGEVVVDGERVKDAKRPVRADASVELESPRYVSRGGDKLEAALTAWQLPVHGKVFLDAGASTGGFTDCLLSHGAAAVHAVDVGYNQLAYRLREDPRVVVHERTNVTEVHSLDPPPDAAVCDLSFRSLAGIARKLMDLTRERWFVALVKPQFEWVDPPDSFDGVVRRREDAHGVLLETLRRLAEDGAPVERLMASPIRGRRGNHEYLALCCGIEKPVAGPEELIAGLGERW